MQARMNRSCQFVLKQQVLVTSKISTDLVPRSVAHPASEQHRARGATDLGFVRSVSDLVDYSLFERELVFPKGVHLAPVAMGR